MTKSNQFHAGTQSWKEYVDSGGDTTKVDTSLWPDYPGGDKQTSINQDASNRSLWEIATTDPFFVNKMLKKGLMPLDESYFNGVFYFELEKANITFRQKRILSEETRAKYAANMSKAHHAREE